MPKVAYFDCPTGISGDMCLGALVDAGVPLEYLIAQLGRLGLAEEYHLRAEFVQRNGQQATKVEVELWPHASHPSFAASQAAQAADLPPASPTDHPGHSHNLDQGHSHSHDHGHSHSHSHSHGTELSEDHLEAEFAAAVPASRRAELEAHLKELREQRQHNHDHAHSHEHFHEPDAMANGSHGHSHDRAHSHSRRLPEIEALILSAQLPERATGWSLAVFRRLAEAEAAVHGIPPEQVHFHEVGATDAIVDIVGTCLGLDYLGIDDLYCSALPIGGGTVWAAHGRLPVPAPAVLKLWEIRQVPVYSNGIDKELVTPTGAALVTVLASQFGPPPPLTLQKTGLGAGAKNLPLPNILRLWIGESGEVGTVAQQVRPDRARHDHGQPPSSASQKLTPQTAAPVEAAPDAGLESVTVLETQIDDLSPQAIGYVMSVLLAAGALDVFTQSVGMKKSRSGLLLTVICRPDQVAACETILFRETTTLGIRRSLQQRIALHRWFEQVSTPYGPVRVKLAGGRSGEITNVQPEYEDCAQLAQRHQVAWREVHRLALQAWHNAVGSPPTTAQPDLTSR